jgi:hypothetical protein
MKNQRIWNFFRQGRKFALTLALFVLIFAAAAVMKVQAGTGDSVIKWLWCGGVTGTPGNTNVGWISMNCTNIPNSCAIVDYGVNIPSADGPVTGYAWSPNIGWIQFDAAPDYTTYPGCGYPMSICYSARREDDSLKGWARILSIKKEFEKVPSNSGGWEGWISLSGANYGVEVTRMTGDGAQPTFAWSELGWIDFSWAEYREPCTLEFVPTIKTMNENSSGTVILQEVGAGATCDSGIVNLAINNPIVNNLSPVSVDFSAPAKETKTITLGIGAVSSDTTFNNAITASSASSGEANLSLIVQNVPICNIDCPSSYTVMSDGAWHAYSCSVSGDAGCVVDSCSKFSGSSKISVQKGSAINTCEVKADTSARYDTAVSQATAGAASDKTNINVKAPGWIETNP